MIPTRDQVMRAHHVAFTVNAALPPEHQAAVFAEEMRVAAEVLSPRYLQGRRVLLIGGGGYIGPVVAEHLLAAGYEVRVLDAFLYGTQSVMVPLLCRPGFHLLAGDFRDETLLAASLEGVTDVIVLAGLVGDPITRKYPELSRRINLDGTLTLLDRLDRRGLNKVVFVSTCSNYGLREDDRPVDEDAPLKPLSLYAEAKVAAEQALLERKAGVDYSGAVLRFATAFGLAPRMRFDLTISQFTRALFQGEDLLVYDPLTWRPYCHVQDFAEVLRRVLEAPRAWVDFDVFNAGGDVNNYTKQAIVDAIGERLPQARVRTQEHGSDPRNYRVDFRRIQKRLGFTPRYTVPDGIRELLNALRQGVFADAEAYRDFHGNHTLPDGLA